MATLWSLPPWNGDIASAALGRFDPVAAPLREIPWGGVIALLTIAVAALAGEARGQENSAVRVEAKSFAFARYASASASSVIAARGFGPVGGFVAIGQNPASGYQERLVGAYTQATWKRARWFAGVAYAEATESQYLQGYLTPSFTRGRVALAATFKSYEPLGRLGVRQLHVNPASLQVRIGGRLSAGVAYVLSMVKAAPPRHSAGPVLEWALPKAVLRVELLDRTWEHRAEVRGIVVTPF